MKIDYRIMGKPHRGTRRIVCVKCGFSTQEDAMAYMTQEQQNGTMDPDAHVRAQKVSDNFDPEEAEKNRKAPMF